MADVLLPRPPSVPSTEKAEKALASTPAVDLSLPKDGKIHINVNLGNKNKDKKKEKSDGGISAGLGGLKLAPPPTAGSSGEKKDKKKDKKDDVFGAPAGAGKAATSDEQPHPPSRTCSGLAARLPLLPLSSPSLSFPLSRLLRRVRQSGRLGHLLMLASAFPVSLAPFRRLLSVVVSSVLPFSPLSFPPSFCAALSSCRVVAVSVRVGWSADERRWNGGLSSAGWKWERGH